MDKKEFFEPEVKVVELEQLILSNSPVTEPETPGEIDPDEEF